MFKKWFISLAAILGLVLSFNLPVSAKTFLSFGGGPVGGTFQYFANGISVFVQKKYADIEISAEGTGGSTANLKLLDKGDIDFGIVYSGDAYLGRVGKLPKDTNKYTKVRAVAYLYGAPAQLVVRADSGINSALDLKGKRVAVGNAGSGAATAAERFFKHIGVWDKFSPQFLGYSAAAAAFNDGKIDAFWVFAGYPTAAIIEAATRDKIKLIDVHKDAEKTGFYKVYPFYTPLEIPANTYSNQTKPVLSFQDAAYWCANQNVPEDVVYRSVKAIYSPEGLKHMVNIKKTAKEMSIENGLKGVSIPVHPGAAKFWKEMGVKVPDLK